MKRSFQIVAALLTGLVLVESIPWVLAIVAAIPGQAPIIRGAKALGLPIWLLYPLLTTTAPIVIFSFACGFLLFRALRSSPWIVIVACAAPWWAMVAWNYINLWAALGNPWWRDLLDSVPGLLVVPLSLVLAAIASRAGAARPPASPLPSGG